MKNIFLAILILTAFSCKAQSIIIPLDNIQHYENNSDYYVKDVNNDLNKFEGTWRYQEGTTEVVFKLKKEEHYLTPSNHYADLLVGEYQYIENGVIVANTLSSFNDTNISGFEHNISGKVFMHTLPNLCIDNSQISEIKISLIISHPTDVYAEGRVILRYVDDNGVEKLEACIYDYTLLGDNAVTLDIPDGYYVFVKE